MSILPLLRSHRHRRSDLDAIARVNDRAAFLDREAELAVGAQDHLADRHVDHVSARLHRAWERAETVSDGPTGGMDGRAGRRLYALTRLIEPQVAVETGVAHGCSTAAILAGMARSNTGRLYSIDLPFRADDDLDEHRSRTYDEFGGVEVPQGRDPGWIVPDDWHDRWVFREGMSQRVLAQLLADCDGIGLFVHDSEHSLPCTSFELEAAWAQLRAGGAVVCDDLSWSDAWEAFVDVRVPDGYHGVLAHDVGYAIKPEDND